ncbi:MAG: electron transfer flavoprotein subunit beta/FixA family protein [Desulfohalobiaceae bacterium]|nr:electron transfer flavoprotein subunit beta/FixA family protein [Desulfohalobiaceae bacterium]
MESIVLIKQVPDTEAAIEVRPEAKDIVEDNLNWVLNPYDEIAVEEALRIREALGGTVTLLCAGPDRCRDALRSGLAMGADRAVLINDPNLEACDQRGVALALAACIQSLDCGLILAGQRAVDDDLQFTGAAVAEELDMAFIPHVIRQEIEGQTVRCLQSTDRETVTVEAELPVLLAAQRGLNEPRYISLPGMMKAKKKPVEVRSLKDLGLDAALLPRPGLSLDRLEVPSSQRAGEMIPGQTPEEQTANLLHRLRELALV